MAFNFENPFTNFKDLFNDDDNKTILESLFLVESDHMLSESYTKTLKARDLDISLRREAVSSLSIFLLEMLQQEPWMLRLLGVSCFSLAAKMRQIEFSISHFQGNGGTIFETQTIQRMEYLIVGALKWRMRSITPFSFLSFFISLFKLKDLPPQEALKARSTEIIFKAQTEIKLLEFKPSIIAASALLLASRELFPLQFLCFKKAISNCSYVNKENMLRCYNAIQETPMEEYDESEIGLVSSSFTPVNVLDRRFSSSESDKTTVTTTNTKCY